MALRDRHTKRVNDDCARAIHAVSGVQAGLGGNEGEGFIGFDGRIKRHAGVGVEPAGHIDAQHGKLLCAVQLIALIDHVRHRATGGTADANAKQAVDHHIQGIFFRPGFDNLAIGGQKRSTGFLGSGTGLVLFAQRQHRDLAFRPLQGGGGHPGVPTVVAGACQHQHVFGF